MILSFSDSEEHIFNKVKEVLNSETVMEYTGELSEPVLSFQGLEIHLKDETVCQNGRLVNLQLAKEIGKKSTVSEVHTNSSWRRI